MKVDELIKQKQIYELFKVLRWFAQSKEAKCPRNRRQMKISNVGEKLNL